MEQMRGKGDEEGDKREREREDRRTFLMPLWMMSLAHSLQGKSAT